MGIAPLPVSGGVHLDARDPSRALRVSAHAEQDLVVISMWRADRCVATHRLRRDELPGPIELLAAALVAPASAQPAAS